MLEVGDLDVCVSRSDFSKEVVAEVVLSSSGLASRAWGAGAWSMEAEVHEGVDDLVLYVRCG